MRLDAAGETLPLKGLYAMPPNNEVRHVHVCRDLQGRPGCPRAPQQDPQYFDKIHKIVEDEGGTVERFLAIVGPWEYLGIFEYPDLEAAFRVLGKIAKLEMFETESSPQRTSRCSGRNSSRATPPPDARWRPPSERPPSVLRVQPRRATGAGGGGRTLGRLERFPATCRPRVSVEPCRAAR